MNAQHEEARRNLRMAVAAMKRPNPDRQEAILRMGWALDALITDEQEINLSNPESLASLVARVKTLNR